VRSLTRKNLHFVQYKQVVSKILSLQGNPRPQDYAALKGYQGGYRIDRDEYRIFYTIDDDNKLVAVFRVGKRNDDEVFDTSRSSEYLKTAVNKP